MSYLNRGRRHKRDIDFFRYDRSSLAWSDEPEFRNLEPDFVKTKRHGKIIIVWRDVLSGGLRGMVGVGKDNPLFESDIEEIADRAEMRGSHFGSDINFSEEHGEDGLCRNPSDINHPVWDESGSVVRWIGFDRWGNPDPFSVDQMINDCDFLSFFFTIMKDDEEDVSDVMESFEWWDS